MSVLSIMINFFDLQSLLVLIFVGMWYKIKNTNSIKIFSRMTAIINPIAIVHFLKQCSIVYLSIC